MLKAFFFLCSAELLLLISQNDFAYGHESHGFFYALVYLVDTSVSFAIAFVFLTALFKKGANGTVTAINMSIISC